MILSDSGIKKLVEDGAITRINSLSIPNPIVERERRAHTREGFAQYMLASLLMGRRPPGWNKPAPASDKGSQLLELLDARCFNSEAWSGRPEIIWEYRIPGLEENSGSGNKWPDLAARWPDRLLLFELKTELGSIREGQVEEYMALAREGFTEGAVDMIYLTREAIQENEPPDVAGTRYANITWAAVVELLTEVWGTDCHGREASVAHWVADYYDQVLVKSALEQQQARKAPVEKGAESDSRRSSEENVADGPSTRDGIVDMALDIALEVEMTGQQAALPYPFSSHNEAVDLRQAIEAALSADNRYSHVRAWVWNSETSGGSPLTGEGGETGLEIRFSRYSTAR